ncbi:sensor histidine kinase [Flavobacterium gelatinilyticum]|uniref:sensor histidine kinase n=1 Tax=Flavobacterium gelatinilyticum TaxID=3003260 RepID=UPI0024802457|nr:ATP-binding protein [Flavobacterium gelatinilyticum]
MIPKYQLFFLYLLISFVAVCSCQENNSDIEEIKNSKIKTENINTDVIYDKGLRNNIVRTESITKQINSIKSQIDNSTETELKNNFLLYIKLSDSLNKINLKNQNQFAAKYNSKNLNLKIKTYKTENELQLERQKNRNIVSYIIILLSLTLILILYFYLTSKANKEKVDATYKSEIRIAKKLHDELANDLYHTIAFTEHKNLSVQENKEQLLNNLDVIYSRIRDISKENSFIVTDENYVFYLKEMISGFHTSNINLLINGLDSICWNCVERNKKITTYRIIQELLVNMKKHSEATLVGINFKEAGKKITINYTDNGKGAAINNKTFKSGLHNIENRIQNIRGEINIDTNPNKGFKVVFKFPI